MENKIIDKIKNFVEEECKKPTSIYGYEPFINHFIPVNLYARQLAEKRKADIEIVEIASWLHDIGSIINGRENHHITGSRIAELKLKELNYPEDKIQKIKHCIFSHRGSKDIIRETEEAKIIAEADAMSHFDMIADLFMVAFITERKNRQEGLKSVKQKLINSWNKLSPEGKIIIKPKYDAVMLLLN